MTNRELGRHSSSEKRLSTGVSGLDDEIGGGLPDTGMGITVIGPHGMGKRLLCMQIMYQALKAGKPGLYVSLDKPFYEIRDTFTKYGLDVTEYEDENKMIIIDCTNTREKRGRSTDNVILVNPSAGIEAYKQTCISVRKDQLGEGGVDIIDSTNSLIQFLGSPEEVIELQKHFKITIGLDMNVIGLHIIDTGTFHDGEVQKISSFHRPIIRFREGDSFNKIRIMGIAGERDTAWMNYDVTAQGIRIRTMKSGMS